MEHHDKIRSENEFLQLPCAISVGDMVILVLNLLTTKSSHKHCGINIHYLDSNPTLSGESKSEEACGFANTL